MWTKAMRGICSYKNGQEPNERQWDPQGVDSSRVAECTRRPGQTSWHSTKLGQVTTWPSSKATMAQWASKAMLLWWPSKATPQASNIEMTVQQACKAMTSRWRNKVMKRSKRSDGITATLISSPGDSEPSEDNYITYFHHLKTDRDFKASSLWSRWTTLKRSSLATSFRSGHGWVFCWV